MALEGKRLNHQLLAANLALSQITHVDTMQAVLGEAPGIVEVDDSSSSHRSFSDFRFMRPPREGRRNSKGRCQQVALDQLVGEKIDRLDLIRFGVGSVAASHAGSEKFRGLVTAVKGSTETLKRLHPWLVLELEPSWVKSSTSKRIDEEEEELRQILGTYDYSCERCDMPFFNSENFRKKARSDIVMPSDALGAPILICGHVVLLTSEAWESAMRSCKNASLKAEASAS
eukprot:TRINITY_DN9598_c0_g1_i1.p1 TRINITY_DN9598_c0_g1~~TRINITY_DN9598_c0_g1_i1.p1  ORF type:complete len:268 (-),score=41.72 TRINITY_DN9598_c0_g1_i1:584-1270(-)